MTDKPKQTLDGDELLDAAFICADTGWSKSHLNEQVRRGRFPKPFKLSPHHKRWLRRSYLTWRADRIAERDAATAN